MVKSSFLTFRTDKDLLEGFLGLLRHDELEKAAEARLVFKIGVMERRKQLALEKYRKEEVTLEKAAEIADLSTFEFIDVLQKENVQYNLDASAVKDYLKRKK